MKNMPRLLRDKKFIGLALLVLAPFGVLYLQSTQLFSRHNNSPVVRVADVSHGDNKKYVRNPISTSSTKPNYVPNEIIIKYKLAEIDLATAAGQAEATTFVTTTIANLISKERFQGGNVELVTIDNPSITIPQKIAELQSHAEVEYAQPNFQYYPGTITDAHYSKQWGAHNTGQTVGGFYPPYTGTSDADIDLPEAFNINEGTNADVIVAVIDDGVAYNHPDLSANMWDGSGCKNENGVVVGGCSHGYNYVENNKLPLPKASSHGTHIAGIIGAIKNTIGITGVAPNSTIMALRMNGTTLQVVKAIEFARHNDAQVINFSWNYYGTAFGSYYDKLTYNTIKNFLGLFVTSAGNGDVNGVGFNHDDGFSDHTNYPAGFRTSTPIGPALGNLMVAAATDMTDSLTLFSDYGKLSVDMGAPGTNIYSTFAGSQLVNETFAGGSIPVGWSALGNWNVASDVLWSDFANPYTTNANTKVTSPAYNMSGVSGATISLEVGCDTEYTPPTGGDYMAFDVSPEGVNYTEILRWNEYSIDQLNYDTSSAGTAVYGFYDVPLPLSSLQSGFRFRLRWVTNSIDSNHAGCYVDSLELIKITDGSDGQYGYLDGTSQAAPYIAGTAALLWGDSPSLIVEEIVSLVSGGGDTKSSLTNKTITGRRVNAKNTLNLAQSDSIIYSGSTFYESILDNGAVSTMIQLHLNGDVFRPSISAGNEVIFSNVPAGLTPVVNRRNAKLVEISFTGNATNHTLADSITNLGIAFQDSAFVHGDASAVLGAATNNINITFNGISSGGGGSGGGGGPTPQSYRRFGIPSAREN